MLTAAAAAAADFPAPAALPANPEPPDPLMLRDGTAVKTADDWKTRRVPELRALFQHYMYGRVPAARPISSKIIRTDAAALGGKATLKEVHVDLGGDAPVHLMIVTPNRRTAPAPCFLGLNFSGNYALLADPLIEMPRGWVSERYAGAPENRAGEAGRGKQIDAWAIEQSIDRGYAVATFFNGDVISDKADIAAKQLQRFLPEGVAADAPDAPATIMVWAWAFSRMVDHLVTDQDIDPRRIAVVGHSRNGKTALLAAAFDERIALAIPSQAGCGGTAPSRVAPEWAAPQANGRPKAETIAIINKNFPHWFCGNFKAFNDDPSKLPFDQHALIALCAPRPVLISCAAEDLWSYPPGQFAMLKAADPVYRLVAGDGIGASEMPETGRLLDSRLGYFIRPGKHSMTREDWKVWLDYADKWLR
jgi:dienelactone hydrolase